MLFKRNKNWYYKFTIGGKTVYKSTGTDNKEKAQEIADMARVEAWKRGSVEAWKRGSVEAWKRGISLKEGKKKLTFGN